MSEIYSERYLNKLFQETKIKEVMISPVETVRIDDKLSAAHKKLMKNTSSHLVVVDQQDRLAGILTQKYIYKTQSPRKLYHESVVIDPNVIVDGGAFYAKEALDSYLLKQVMKPDPFALKMDASIADAIVNMARKRLGCIPIIDDKRHVLGVVTDYEIVKFMSDVIARQSI